MNEARDAADTQQLMAGQIPDPSDAAKWAAAICQAVEATDAKATQYGSSEWVEAYVIPAGPWHLILGLCRGGLWPEYVNDKLRDGSGT